MKRNILTVGALFVALSAVAVPAKRKPFVFRQPDGTEITVTLIGDEYEHYYLTAEGDTLAPLQLPPVGGGFDGAESEWWLVPKAMAEGAPQRNGLRRAKQRAETTNTPPKGGRRRGAIGSPRELVLLVEYPDCRFTYPAETLRRMLCEEGYHDDGATGSARDYFRDQSQGLFTPDIEVVGPIMLPHPRAYYGTPTANMYDGQPWLMLTDAAPLVDDAVDFSRFDNDGDGFVDNVFIFYAGKGQNDGGPLESVWPHAANIWTYYALDCTLDGVQLGSYACTNEVTGADRLTGIGTFCHEYSHVLGLPDLYSTLSASDCFSPGAFELMDSGSYNNEGRTPPNMSAYDRMVLGWCRPEPLTAPETVVLANDGEARSIATVKEEEYYLLENRQQTGWDAFLPGHGMLIWHIDYDERAWTNNQVNVLPGHQRVDLVEADGVLTKETQDGDPFPGARQTTAVNLLPWTGVPIDAAITEIREEPAAYATGTGAVTFKFRGGGERIEAPVALAAEEVGPCGFTATWTGVPAVTEYEVVVWRGDEIAALDVAASTAVQRETDGRWTATVSGLVPETRYRYGVVAIDGERRSPVSNTVEVTTAAPTFDMLAPTDVVAEVYNGDDDDDDNDNDGGDGGLGSLRWRLTWTALDEAVAYEAEVYGHQVVAPEVVTLDFTGGIAALPAGWTTTSTQTSGVAGTFGAARPSLMLQPGEWLLSPAFAEGINDYSLWSQGEVAAALLGAGHQLRLANAGEGPAYVDDVAVTYGGRTEQVGTALYSTADKTAAPALNAGNTNGAASTGAASTDSNNAARTWMVVPGSDGALWCRVRGVRGDGARSAWSEEVALPTLEGIGNVRIDGAQSGELRYTIPPFIGIYGDGTKRTW